MLQYTESKSVDRLYLHSKQQLSMSKDQFDDADTPKQQQIKSL